VRRADRFPAPFDFHAMRSIRLPAGSIAAPQPPPERQIGTTEPTTPGLTERAREGEGARRTEEQPTEEAASEATKQRARTLRRTKKAITIFVRRFMEVTQHSASVRSLRM